MTVATKPIVTSVPTTHFTKFSAAVSKRATELGKHRLFEVDVDRDELFEHYLAAFPHGTDPIYKKRTEHDCVCCKRFIRNMGNVVAIVSGKIETIWDVDVPEPYDQVAAKLAEAVRSKAIRSIFVTQDRKIGQKESFSLVDGVTQKYDHFYCDVPVGSVNAMPDKERGEYTTKAGVFKRGLNELTREGIDAVLDLINQNAVYRGAEFKSLVVAFKDAHEAYHKLATEQDKINFVWLNAKEFYSAFKNTVIGTLVSDISEGYEIEDAVKSFEVKVAPTNYKRTTSLITPKMIENAMKVVNDNGFDRSIERRFAKFSDVSVNDVLFVNVSSREKMKDGLTALLMKETKKTEVVKTSDLSKIAVEDFFSRIVPQSESISLLLENTHLQNFVSITAPVHEDSPRLFKWGNNFAWTYDGDVADSIKQRVKKAGGNVNAPLRVSLSWFNTDDLDLHAICPEGHVYYGDKKNVLDVDMNVTNYVRDPVENLSWSKPRDGRYEIYVKNYRKRESIDLGFVLEIECNGVIEQYSHKKAITDSNQIQCISFRIKCGQITDFVIHTNDLVKGSTPVEKWGVKTGGFVDVQTLMLSPNHWGDQKIGNKHWFFILKDCLNPDEARGIYNEFLRPEMEPHRKVFEVIGARTRCPKSQEQLSGLGFSSTKNDRVIVSVKGKINGKFEVQF